MSNLSFTPQTRQCFSKPRNRALTPVHILCLCFETGPRHNEVGCVSSSDLDQSRWPLQALLVSFMPLVSGVWCGAAGRPNTWTASKAAQVSPQSCLPAQRRRAEAAEPEVLRSHPLPLQRPAESVAGGTQPLSAVQVCCLGHVLKTFRKPQSSAQRCYLSQVQSTCWGRRQWKACGIRYRDGGCL